MPDICPHCSKDISHFVRKAIKVAQSKNGAKGGSKTGVSKLRAVDYSALARASHRARKTNQDKLIDATLRKTRRIQERAIALMHADVDEF